MAFKTVAAQDAAEIERIEMAAGVLVAQMDRLLLVCASAQVAARARSDCVGGAVFAGCAVVG